MSGHEFEKQVRQKLNDLKMTPSVEAWENIEQNLRERKRRFAPVLWLPLLFLGLVAGGYFIFNSGDKNELVASVAPQASNKKENKDVASGGVLTDAPQVDGKSASAPQAKENSSAPQVNRNDLSAPQATQNKDVASGGVLTDAPQVDGKSASAPQAKENSSAPQVNRNDLSAPQATQNKDVASGGVLTDAPQVNGKSASAPQAKENFLSTYNKIPSLNSLTGKSIINAPTLHFNNSSSTKSPVQKPKTSKWSWGLNGVAGVSSVSEGDFFNLNFNKAEVEDVATVAFFAPQPYRPSSISPGLTYSVGGFVKRELSKKFSLSAGLNYLQLNTRNKVGSRINARQVVNNGNRGYMIVSSYYTLQQDQPSEYRNRYHFLELPIELHTRVNKSEKVPMHINTGFAVSRLLKSNSLHFDGSSGVYYKNDKLLNRTQVAAKAGFSFELLNNTTRPIWIGPYARYNISRILQKDVSASKSFASFGLDMKLFIR